MKTALLGTCLLLSSALLCACEGDAPGPAAEQEMVRTWTTPKSIAQVGKDLRAACKRHKFGVIGEIDLQAKMKEKGVDFETPCVIFEICNPHRAKEVLSAKMEIATALPCRVAAYRKGEVTHVATIAPGRMLQMFDVPALAPVAAAVEKDIFVILDETTAP